MHKHFLKTNVLIVILLSCFLSCEDYPTGSKVNGLTVVTDEVSAITSTSAQCGGVITYGGEDTVISRGVCWSTGQTPSVSDNKTADGTGAGSYTSYISGLTASTKYYVRAYAISNAGTSYGSIKSFTTASHTGSVKIQYSTEWSPSITSTEVVISSPNMDTLFYLFQNNDNPLTIDSIPAGLDRKVELFLYSADTLILYGSESTKIREGVLSRISISLYPMREGYRIINGKLCADYFPLRIGNTWTYSYYLYSSEPSLMTPTIIVNGNVFWQIVDAVVRDSSKEYLFNEKIVVTQAEILSDTTITEIDIDTSFTIIEYFNHELKAKGSSPPLINPVNFVVRPINSFSLYIDQGFLIQPINRYLPVSEFPDTVRVIAYPINYSSTELLAFAKGKGVIRYSFDHVSNSLIRKQIKLIDMDVKY